MKRTLTKLAAAGVGTAVTLSVISECDRAQDFDEEYEHISSREVIEAKKSLGDQVSSEEVDAAIQTLADRKDIIRSMVPNLPKQAQSFIFENQTQLDTMFEQVRNILVSEPNLIESANANKAKRSAKFTPEPFKIFNMSPMSKEWEALREQHNCTICQDVLAAPCLLNCTHSFCGSCLHDWIMNCEDSSANDDDNNYYYFDFSSFSTRRTNAPVPKKQPSTCFCPTCKSEIENSTFARNHADSIESTVNSLADAPWTRSWHERNDSYHHLTSEKNRKEQRNRQANKESDSETNKWMQLILSAMTIAVISIIVFMRK